MASDKSQLGFVLDQMRKAGIVTARAMFGEYGIYCDGTIVALFCDNQLFVKPTDGGRALVRNPVEAPPYPGARPYFLIEDQIENGEWVSELIRVTAQELRKPGEKSKAGRTTSAQKAVRPTRRSRGLPSGSGRRR